MRRGSVLCLVCLATAAPAEQTTVTANATDAAGGVVRVLDKTSGATVDLELARGQTGSMGALTVTLDDCRFPTDNPSGDAFEHLTIHYRAATDPVFSGWMIASSPALNAMDHPRYDVWALRCSTS
jgi:hypothetical protein